MRSGVAGAGGLRDRSLAWPWTESGSGCAYPRGGVGSGRVGSGSAWPPVRGMPATAEPARGAGLPHPKGARPGAAEAVPCPSGGSPRAAPLPRASVSPPRGAESRNSKPRGAAGSAPTPSSPAGAPSQGADGDGAAGEGAPGAASGGGTPRLGIPQLGPPSARPWTRLCRCPIAEALRSLSFLGLRAPPCTPLWGRELLRGRSGGVLLPVTLLTQLSPCPGLSPCLWPPHIPSLHPITALLAGVGTLVAQSASLLGDTSHCGPPLTLPCSPQDPPRGSVGPGSPRGCTSARTWWDAVCSSTHCWTTRRALW